MAEVYTARNSGRGYKHHGGVPERYREGYVAPSPASEAQRLREGRNVRLRLRMDRHYAIMRTGTAKQRSAELLLQHLYSIREAENMEALQRRYLAILDRIEQARVGESINLAETDRLFKIALNASNKRAEELVPCPK